MSSTISVLWLYFYLHIFVDVCLLKVYATLMILCCYLMTSSCFRGMQYLLILMGMYFHVNSCQDFVYPFGSLCPNLVSFYFFWTFIVIKKCLRLLWLLVRMVSYWFLIFQLEFFVLFSALFYIVQSVMLKECQAFPFVCAFIPLKSEYCVRLRNSYNSNSIACISVRLSVTQFSGTFILGVTN